MQTYKKQGRISKKKTRDRKCRSLKISEKEQGKAVGCGSLSLRVKRAIGKRRRQVFKIEKVGDVKDVINCSLPLKEDDKAASSIDSTSPVSQPPPIFNFTPYSDSILLSYFKVYVARLENRKNRENKVLPVPSHLMTYCQ